MQCGERHEWSRRVRPGTYDDVGTQSAQEPEASHEAHRKIGQPAQPPRSVRAAVWVDLQGDKRSSRGSNQLLRHPARGPTESRANRLTCRFKRLRHGERWSHMPSGAPRGKQDQRRAERAQWFTRRRRRESSGTMRHASGTMTNARRSQKPPSTRTSATVWAPALPAVRPASTSASARPRECASPAPPR